MNKIALLLSSFGIASAALVFVACSSESPAAPSVPPPGAVPGVDGGGGTGEGGTDGGPSGTQCYDPKAKPPSTPSEFLNLCNDAGCLPFDNATRIEGFTPGAPLPPLN